MGWRPLSSLRLRKFAGHSLLYTLLPALILVLTSAHAAPAQERTWAEKMFDSLSHDFGVVARGADVRYRFKVTNLYKESVHISNVRTTCGCTAAKPTKETLASRGVAYIEVTMNTQRFIRRKDSNLIVTFDEPLFAEVRLPITAYIRSDVVFRPGSVDFGEVDFGSESERKVEVAYAGRTDWTIRDVKVHNEHLAAKVVETGRSNGRVDYDLVVTLNRTAPVGRFNEQILLVTDDADSPPVPVLVTARVEPDITVTPETVSLGKLNPGEKKTFNVVLRGKKPFAIKTIECDSDREVFTVRLSKEAKQVHVLPMAVTPPDAPGSYRERFTVTIDGREEPITFEAYGTIVGPETK